MLWDTHTEGGTPRAACELQQRIACMRCVMSQVEDPERPRARKRYGELRVRALERGKTNNDG